MDPTFTRIPIENYDDLWLHRLPQDRTPYREPDTATKRNSPNALKVGKSRGYRCDICMKSIARLHDLRRHKQSAHRSCRFLCGHCDKCFQRKDKMTYHIKVNHKLETGTYITCRFGECSNEDYTSAKYFVTPEAYHEHMKLGHSQEARVVSREWAAILLLVC